MSDRVRDEPGELPIVDGSLYGILAYVTGYLTTLLLVIVFEGERFVGDLVQGAGWIYYNAQFVRIEQRPPPGSPSVESVASLNYVTGEGLDSLGASPIVVPSLVYQAIPIAVLLGAGFLLARSHDVEGVVSGAKVGASLAFGCVVLALGGTFVFEVADVMGPERINSVARVGVFYPVICGALGGVLSVLLSRD